jgi:hypothetical protein
MMCKDNFVHYVKEITSRQVLAYNPYAHYAILSWT